MVKRYFKGNDSLGRKQYADFLKMITQNSNHYKRVCESNSYTIAVDASWGTGKTYFVDMFETYLEGKESKDDPKKDSEFAVIRFDAWKSDFWDNAFEPFASTILEDLSFQKEKDGKNAEGVMLSIGKAAAIIAKGIAKKRIETYIEVSDAEEALKTLGKSTKAYLLQETSAFSEYQEFKKTMEDFKESLKKIMNSEKKLVIIIDELDRCKPTFAIELLEIVKHLFDIENIVFIFFMDIEQLSHSIKTVYGAEIDASGYLCRFFDYISRMPKPNMKTYSRLNLLDNLIYKGCTIQNRDKFIDFSLFLCNKFLLSLRDLDTILCSYRIMQDSFLDQYRFIDAHFIYYFYLTLKYKDIEEFNNLFLKNRKVNPEYITNTSDYECIDISLNHLSQTIGKIKCFLYDSSSDVYLKDSRGEPIYIEGVQNDRITLKNSQNIPTNNFIPLTEGEYRLDKLLFTPDIKVWESIKDLTYGDYIHQQLEMFTFVPKEK